MNKQGFSLIELLAIIAIIAIVALITYPVIGQVIENSEMKTFKNTTEELIHIVEIDYTECSRNGEVTYKLNGNKIAANSESSICNKKNKHIKYNDISYNGEIENTDKTEPSEVVNIIVKDGTVKSGTVQNDYYIAKIDEKGKVEITKKD